MNSLTTKILSKPFFLFFFLFAIVVLRRPDIINNAQPWAEDGIFWLQGIYNDGFWSSLLLPANGYYQTISRLTYGFALIFGVNNAALVANCIAIAIRVTFVLFILSPRMSFISIPYRVALALYIILMPNLTEGYVNITNIHWYLSMYLMCIIVANHPHSKKEKAHDYFVLIISALSGPFVIFMAPALLLRRIAERGNIVNTIKKINTFDVIFTITFLIQIISILLSSSATRSNAPLGFSIQLLADIITYRVFIGTFIKNSWLAFEGGHFISIVIFLLVILSLAYYTYKSGWRFLALLIFPVLMISFGLAKPMMSMQDPQWPLFLTPDTGERYFFVTNVAFYSFVLFIISRVARANQKAGHLFLLGINVVMIILYSNYFKISPLVEVGYKQQIEDFKNSPVGTEQDININPPGWKMHLIKK